MFEFRLRVLEAGPSSYLGIVEGLPEILVHGATPHGAEADLIRAINDWFERHMDDHSTLLQLDDMPTVRLLRVALTASPT